MKVSLKYRHIAKRLSTVQLQSVDTDSSLISEADFFYRNVAGRGHNFFLGYYSEKGLKTVFEKYGIYKKFAEKGFHDIKMKLDTSDTYLHRISLYDVEIKPDRLLAEVVMKLGTFEIKMPFNTPLNGNHYKTIGIEWMRLQNPKESFTKKRPRLPGQHYPGLGIATQVVELLMIAAWRLKLAGLMNNPEHYHNAYLYSRVFCYENPLHQAKLLAVSRDLKKYPLDKIAWAMEWDAVIEKNSGEVEKWFAGKQIIPFYKELKKLYCCKDYLKIVDEKKKEYKYILDENKYNMMKKRSDDEAKSNSTS